MNNNMSPLEKARQILLSIALEEENRLNQTRSVKPEPSENEEPPSGEGSSSESRDANMAYEIPEQQSPSGADRNQPDYKSDSLLSFDSDSILKGILFSEILGKPRSRRRGW